MRVARLVSEGRTEWELLNNLGIAEVQDLLRSIPSPTKEPPKDAEGRVVALGIHALTAQLRVALDDPTCNLVIVICDAEGDPAADRWQEIRDELVKRAFEAVPEAMPVEGTVVSNQEDKRVGVWIMPDNSSTGMIEDFFWAAIPEENEEKSLAHNYVSSVPRPKFKGKLSKAKLYAWLAVQKDPSAHPWQAFRWTWIKRDRGSVPLFLRWIERLLLD